MEEDTSALKRSRLIEKSSSDIEKYRYSLPFEIARITVIRSPSTDISLTNARSDILLIRVIFLADELSLARRS